METRYWIAAFADLGGQGTLYITLDQPRSCVVPEDLWNHAEAEVRRKHKGVLLALTPVAFNAVSKVNRST
jgi:hypothetical protein